MSLFDMFKATASIMSQNRLLEAVAGQVNEVRFLAYLDIAGDMAKRMGNS
ncbi:hypothetical protein [Sphingobium estronivorans]|nr:hypothetical protein [Sphingobium estronivorans]